MGTSKNGTSFLVNNLAALLSSKGINTAILDLTKNKNSYYIYTLNEDSLRDRAFRCIEGLRRGVAEGIQVDKILQSTQMLQKTMIQNMTIMEIF